MDTKIAGVFLHVVSPVKLPFLTLGLSDEQHGLGWWCIAMNASYLWFTVYMVGQWR